MRSLVLAAMCCVGVARSSLAQEPGTTPPQTRAEAIGAERAEKIAELWPERQNAMVDLVNGFAERGLNEGLDSGKGSNGVQFTLGGMRADQGMSFGIGYRRSDFLRDHLGYRATARGTVWGAYMFDFNVDFRGIQTERTYLQWYTKYEHSPSINFFGVGNDTTDARRASYLFNDLSSDFSAAIAPVRVFRVGATGGYYRAHTAASGDTDFPPIDEAFPPDRLMGFGKDTQYMRVGGFAISTRATRRRARARGRSWASGIASTGISSATSSHSGRRSTSSSSTFRTTTAAAS